MSAERHGAHYDEETCWAYALDALEPDAAAELERHLADCNECAELVGGLYRERAEARRWNAALHGRAWRRERLGVWLASAIAAAEGTLKDALESWRQAGAAAAGMVRAERGEGGVWWMADLAVAPVGSGIHTRGAIRVGARPRPGAAVEIRLPDGSRAVAGMEGASVVVRFPGRSPNSPPPPVLLAPNDDSEAVQAVLAQWDDAQHEWRAALEPPRGGFEVVVGPADSEV